MKTIKMMVSLFLVFVIVMTFAATAFAEDKTVYDPSHAGRVFCAVYDGEVKIITDDREERNYVVVYCDMKEDSYEGLSFFWLAYVVPGEEPEVWMLLETEDHFLKINREGEYVLMVSEEALHDAYVLWEEFGLDSEETSVIS